MRKSEIWVKEQELLNELFLSDVTIEEKVKLHAEFRIKYKPTYPYSKETILIAAWENMGLLPKGSWKKACAKINNERRKGFAKVRKELRKKVNCCERCRSEKDLQVHHKIPVIAGGSHEESNLVVLCKKCHKDLDRCTCDFFTFMMKCKKFCYEEWLKKQWWYNFHIPEDDDEDD
jgi:hypothetical protein